MVQVGVRWAWAVAAVVFGASACSSSDGGSSAEPSGGQGGTADGTDGFVGNGDITTPGASQDTVDGDTTGTDGTTATDSTDGTDGGVGTDGTGATDGTGGTDGSLICPGGCGEGEECISGVCAVPQVCEPNKAFCQGLTAVKKCNADGTAFLDPVMCPDQQLCTGGKCGSPECVVDPKLGAYVGCRFWSVDLPNYKDPTINPTPEDSPHAVVVSNPGDLEATITFVGPNGTNIVPGNPVVAGHSSQVFIMPILNVQHSGIFDLGIEVNSTRPVLVHQFNPWDNKYSNDASLLLPENVLGKDYVVLTWPTSPLDIITIPGFTPPENQNGYFTAVAIEDGTEISFQVSAGVRKTAQIPKLAAGQVHTVTLNRGQVLNIEVDTESLFTPADASGSRIWGNKPFAAFAGHEEAVVGPPTQSGGEGGSNSCCADHLEEQLLPTNILGTSYVAAKAKPRGTEVDIWRIQAADTNVTISTDPPQKTTDGKTLTNFALSQKGQWIEVQTADSFVVTSDKPIQVMQYLVSQAYTEDFIGDPSLITAIPTERYRTLYALSVPPLSESVLGTPLFGENYLTIIKQTDAPVNVDGSAVAESEFKTFGGSGWRVGYVSLTAGIHTADSTAPFGLSVYGFNGAVSYGFPGGLQVDINANATP